MNALFGTVVFGLAIVAQANGQGQCGCAPQLTVIQISCNGGGNHGISPQYPPPAPPPAGPPAQEYYETSEPSFPDHTDYSENYGNTDAYGNPESQDHSEGPVMDDYEVDCAFDHNGVPQSSPPGGWPAGFRRKPVPCADMSCMPEIFLDDPNQIRPSPNWEGGFSDLGFSMVPGTPTYNMVKCWPLRVTLSNHGSEHKWIEVHDAQEFETWLG